ncbi:LOG family protein [Cerasicoccus arenae]|uniref:AMP nucleosidase n=1 Tax=Cerasicoccus arenae TaxID=424488 RepID=A0A8J3DCV0_9BACT|nr:LOG family protein [Cerasicoccus arenae]MBK1858311.1 LOG family protein [Cerasicoccus arenae]GHB90694.1 lysine decarboxylase [Cerasicoccus arenae]
MNDQSPSNDWPIKAYNNIDFLNSSDARHIRILAELAEPQKRLREMGIENTIVFFGSARIPDSNIARERLAVAEQEAAEGKPGDEALAQRLRVARRHVRAAPFHDKAIELARLLAEWSKTIAEREKRFYICTGGGDGMMRAANHGAYLADMPSVGLGISLPFEPELNPYIPHNLQFEFHYFMIRKYWFSYLAKAMVVTPGGFGTMDELFELMTLIQTHKIEKHMPIVLLGSEFWNDIINFQSFVDWGVISEQDLGLFRIMDDVEEARDWIVEELTTHYLRPVSDDPGV